MKEKLEKMRTLCDTLNRFAYEYYVLDNPSVEDIVYDDNSHKFTVRCYLNGYYVDGEGSKVKEAKKQAAFNMMKYMGLVD